MSARSAEDSMTVDLLLCHPNAMTGIIARCIAADSSLTEYICNISLKKWPKNYNMSMVNSRCCYTFDTDKIRLFNKKNSWHVITGLTLFFWFYPVLQAENQLLSQEAGIVLYANPHITRLTNTLFAQISSLKNTQWQTFGFECSV